MQNTVVSPLVHSPDEHSIVAMLEGVVAQSVIAIQIQLEALLGDAIWLTPPNALHMTLMEIICDTQYTGMSRGEHFLQWYEQYNHAARETIAQFGPFDVTLSELHASKGAIILKAAASEPFNAVRAKLLENTVLPAETKTPPDITHCSIARYNQAIDLDSVRERTRDIAVNLTIHVTEFKLMKDLGPDFHPKPLEVYRLLGEAVNRGSVTIIRN